jgi:hypothetical protein
MKYLKLFEDHKETSDKISEIEKNAQNKKEEVINGYKALIDEMMYDISDDYEIESVINIKYDSISDCKTYLDYKIYFTSDRYEDVLDKLLVIVDMLKEAYDITYNLSSIFDTMGGRLSGHFYRLINPFDFYEAKNIIKNHLNRNSRTNPSDIKLMINISF